MCSGVRVHRDRCGTRDDLTSITEENGMAQVSLGRKAAAEFLGTFWLTFGGCGSAVLAVAFQTATEPPLLLGIGLLGVSFAFGLTVLTGAYAFGHISGGHFNPAVSFGLWAGKRFPASELVPYIIAQVAGAIVAAIVLYLIASGKDGFGVLRGALASNGYGQLSPGKYALYACFVAEVVLTFMFLMVILGATDSRAPAGFAPIAIGLCLTLIHLISIPVTNTSVNPARSTGPALVVMLAGGREYITQLWLFWVAPIVGGIIAGVVYPAVAGESTR
jgi:aquaporin Z